ncbi:alpha/beta fold hydrolase [uncultured Alsobacter sp.]|uniref:alpha/beta fold hydrolase n=1 Tax=uncultured Alsobacter sp. TaxID=1748258 RepID=UPI0025D95D36|nr:alpha/beta hydrolase [uncultured Alsobacter sp.]
MSVHVRFDRFVTPRDALDAVQGLCGVAGNPVPLRPRLRLLRSEGALLRTAAWLPPGRTRGTVLLLQGRGDFIEKYFEVIADLLARGFAVATFDWRGQGGSQRLLPNPAKGHVDGFARYVGDVATVVGDILTALPRPWTGLAHSMGAAILLHALVRRDASLDRAVLTAPMVGLSPALAPVGARALASALDWAGLGTATVPGPARRGQAAPAFQPDNWLTSDPVRYLRSYDILKEAPRLGVGKPTIGWLKAAYDGMAGLRGEALATIDTPILVVAGDRDRVTHTPAALALARRMPSAEAVVIEGAAHDVMMERDALRDRFWTAFDGFTAQRRTPLATGSR